MKKETFTQEEVGYCKNVHFFVKVEFGAWKEAQDSFVPFRGGGNDRKHLVEVEMKVNVYSWQSVFSIQSVCQIGKYS